MFLFCECADHALLHVVISPENCAEFLGAWPGFPDLYLPQRSKKPSPMVALWNQM